MTEVFFQVTNLSKAYPLDKPWFTKPKCWIHPIRGVSFELKKDEILGIAGESGSGKTTLLKVLAGLEPYDQGEVTFLGELLPKKWRPQQEKQLRQKLQVVFQDPYESLNLKHTLGYIFQEAVKIRSKSLASKRSKTAGTTEKAQQTSQQIIQQALEKVGLPESYLKRYPSDISGGQRQRVLIARCLILQPLLLLADEPVSALDISVQAQVLNYLVELQAELKFALIVVSHDLALLKNLCDRILIYYGGMVVEETSTDNLLSGVHHPYTMHLFDFKRSGADKNSLEVPANDFNPLEFSGCPFYFLCPLRSPLCQTPPPSLLKDGRKLACHHIEKLPNL